MSDLQASVTRLHTQLSRTREAGAAVEAELAGVRKEAGVERAHKERQVKILADMASTDDQQVALLQSALGLKIMGAGGESCYDASHRTWSGRDGRGSNARVESVKERKANIGYMGKQDADR